MAYVITQMGHWLVKENGGWTLKFSEAAKFDTMEAALQRAYHMGRNDLQVKFVAEAK